MKKNYQKNVRKKNSDNEEDAYKISKTSELNNYETEQNKVTNILDSRSVGGSYEYLVERENGTKEWRSCEDCIPYINLVCDFVAKKVTIIQDPLPEKPIQDSTESKEEDTIPFIKEEYSITTNTPKLLKYIQPKKEIIIVPSPLEKKNLEGKN